MKFRFVLLFLASLLMLTGCSVQQPLVIYGKKDASVPKALTATTTPTSANFTWQWSQGASTPDIVGFKLSLGMVPQTYTRVLDIADKNARSFIVTGLDLTRFNYAILQAVTDFGMLSGATPELVFGGVPSAPVFLKAAPVTP